MAKNMRTFTDQEKIEVFNKVLNPMMQVISPDRMAGCMAEYIRLYTESSEFVNDEVDVRAAMLCTGGLLTEKLNQLAAHFCND